MISLTNWKGDVLSLLAGCILPLAFAPFAWWPLVIVSLFLFLHCIRDVSTRRAGWRGLLFGLGYFGVGVSWVYVSISLFGNASMPLAAGITVLLILVLSAYIALATYLTRRLLNANASLALLLVFPAVWVLIEWLRGWLFTGFGWLQVGYAMIDTPLAEYAPWIGVLGLSYLSVFSAVLLLVLLSKKSGIWARLLGIGLLLSIWSVPYFIDLPTGSEPYGTAQQVALIQGNIPQQRKWLKSERQPTLAMYRNLTEKHWDKDIIIWPETAIPAFEDQVTSYLETMHYVAQLSNTTLMTGLPVREAEGKRYYNALVVLGNADRSEDTIYSKRHLVPFGEYLPLKFLLDPVLGYLEIPMSDFSAGEQGQPLVKAGNHQAGIFICFEIAFGSDVLDAMPEVDYLVNVSNDAWFGDSLAPHQHLQIARLRALETGRYVLRSTNTGISAIIEPDGELQGVLPQFKRQVLTGSIRTIKGSTAYSRYGDYPLLSLIVILLILMWRATRKQR